MIDMPNPLFGVAVHTSYIALREKVVVLGYDRIVLHPYLLNQLLHPKDPDQQLEYAISDLTRIAFSKLDRVVDDAVQAYHVPTEEEDS